MNKTLLCNFVVDKPTINGRVYPRAVMEAAIKQYMEKHQDQRLGEFSGEGVNAGKNFVDLVAVSHKVKNVELLHTGEIEVEIETLETPQGKVLDKMFPIAEMIPNLIMVGQLKDNVIEDLAINIIDIVFKPTEQKT